MRAAWKIIEERFTHIFAIGCAAHSTNLLIIDILDTTEASKIIKDSEKVIKFVTNHHLVKAKYVEQRKLAKIPKTLSLSVPTCWYTRFTSGQVLC